ncbi:hypothetical protein ACHQM5_030028 [Ranunculus cassubicifolius]
MDPSKNYDPFQYNVTNDAPGASNQRYVHDPSSSVNTNIRPPDFSQGGGTRPVNFSIQTGEEFAAEFMRERSIPKRPLIPTPVTDGNNVTYMDLKGILGISHAGSDSGSDVSRFSTVDKARAKEFEKKGSYGNETRAYYESSRSVPRSISRNSGSQAVPYGYPSSGASDSSSAKIKFLCSFGGKILPRPSDGRLRYVGGETRIIQVHKAISWEELLRKTMLMCNQAHTIKYQLPGEDLDALVSVSCDEDLQNMLEECNIIEDGGRSQKPRMFLVSTSEFDDPHLGLGSMDGDSEVQYVVAVNGMDLGSKRNSSGRLVSTSENAFDQLLGLNAETEASRAARESAATNAFPFASTPAPPTTTQPTPTEGLISAISAPEKGVSFFNQNNEGKQQDPVLDLLPPDAANSGQSYKANDEDPVIYAGGHNGGYTGSEADSTDFGYEAVVPQRVFHSERIPHKLAEPEVQNRLSKSDDSFSTQFLMTQSRSGMSQQEPITESVEKSNEELANTISNMNLSEPRSESKNFDLNREVSVDETKASGIDSSSSYITSKPIEDPASSLPEVNWGEIATNATNSNNTMEPASSSSQVGTSKESRQAETVAPKRDGVLIDINDRFPRDFLSDIFSRERLSEDLANINSAYNDGTGVSLNMENHNPQHWSFFQKLAQDEFVRKDVSLMDQDHLGYSSPLTTVGEDAPGAYNFPPLKTGLSPLRPADPQIHFEETVHQEPTINVGSDNTDAHLDYNPSQLKGTAFTQFDVMSYPKTGENTGTPESDYEDGKSGISDFGGALLESSSMGEVDFSTLQLIKNEDLEELKELGSGTFGTVYHGKWRGTDVAIKRIKKSCFTGRSSEQERLTLEFWREADILSKLHHPNVVAFYGVVQDGPGATMATVTEFMVNGSLRHVLLRKDKYLDRRKRLIIAMDAAFGMEYLHSKNIVHFDLKCDNLLVNLKDPQRPICKVGDFGLSKIKRNTLVTGGVRGTLPWMAPELLNGSSSKVSEKVDVFSFGIVLWEILTGEEPYANMHYGAIIGGIVSNTLRPLVPSFCDSEWKRLMEQCWAPDPVARPSFTEIASRLRVMSRAPPPPTQQNK